MRKNTQLVVVLCSLIWIATLSESIGQKPDPRYRWELGVNAYTHLYSDFQFGPIEAADLWLPGGYFKYHLPYGLSLGGFYYQFHQSTIFQGIGTAFSTINNHSMGWSFEKTKNFNPMIGYHFGFSTMYSLQNEDHHGSTDVPPYYYESSGVNQVLRIMPLVGINFFIKKQITISYRVQFVLYRYRHLETNSFVYNESQWLNGFLGHGTLSVGYRFGKV